MTNNIERLNSMLGEVEKFNKKQLMEAFYWMALGDGHIEKPLRGDCLLSISHILKHEDYICWKASIIERALRCSVKPNRNKSFNGHCDTWRLRTQHHPWFTKVRKNIYEPLGRKMIDSMSLSLLDSLGLAILYQDDGSYHYSINAGHNILIHKLCFSFFELQALAKTIVDKWGIIFRINETKGKGFGYRLRLRASDKDKFFNLIMPYIVPSMLYKVGKGGTSSEVVI